MEQMEEFRRAEEEEEEAIIFLGVVVVEREEAETEYAPGPGVSAAHSFHLRDLSRETAAANFFSSLGL